MKVKILGTCAAEGWPGLFCSCQACRKARELGGPNIRTRSGALIDGVLKIDLCPDTYHHVITYGLDATEWKHIFITHSHPDHLALHELPYLAPPFAYRDAAETKTLYGNTDVIAKVREHLPERAQCDLRTVAPFQRVAAGPYTVTPILAQHGIDATPLNYLFEREGKVVLYACDTGVYDDDTWDALKGSRVDLAVVECCGGPLHLDYGTHMGLPNVAVYRTRCEQLSITDRDTRWVLTHFSHGGGALHSDLVSMTAPLGYEIAFDGMELVV